MLCTSSNRRGDTVPYNMWYLTPDPKAVPAKDLIDFVAELGDGQTAAVAEGTEKNWKRLEVTSTDGSWGFDIERTVVGKTGRGPTKSQTFRRRWATSNRR
jgi:hypothetical protein